MLDLLGLGRVSVFAFFFVVRKGNSVLYDESIINGMLNETFDSSVEDSK